MGRLALALVLGFIFGCSPEHLPFREDGLLNPPQKAVEAISFNELYTRVLEPKCIACHDSGGALNFDSPIEARKHLNKIRESVLLSRRMPKAPFLPLTQIELELVSAWLKAGGPEIPLNGAPEPDISPLQPNFSAIYLKIIIPRCIACHRAGGEAPRVPLNTVADLINSPLEIVLPGNPDESGLILVIQPGARKKMPPIKSGIGALKDSEIAVIKAWIAAGAHQ